MNVAPSQTRRRLALLGVGAFATMAALRVCDPLLPALATDFTVTTGSAGRTVSAFAIAYGLALLAYGPLADRIGSLRVILGAMAASALGSMASALAPSLDALVTLRALSGAAAAGVTPLAMAWIGDHVGYAQRQEALARLVGSAILGMVAAQWLGGLLAETIGWRSALVALAALFAVAAVLMLVEFRGGEEPRMESNGRSTTAAPVADLRAVLGEPWCRRVLAFSACEGVLAFGGLAFLPAHLHQHFALPMSVAAGVLTLYGLGGVLYSRIAARLLGRFGETGLARLGGALMGAYFILLAVMPSWLLALPACLAGGLGFYMLHTTLQTHATEMAPAMRGTAVTLFSAALFMGQSLGVAIAAVIVDRSSAVPVFVISALALPVLGFAFAREIHRRRVARMP
ncbi:MAG: MFS transporter [Burkholderiales bacterium]|nr:MFS transporter [Burkholderiales bacterium]